MVQAGRAGWSPRSTLVFAFGRSLGAVLRRRVRIGPAAVYAAQVPLSVHAGYFGGG